MTAHPTGTVTFLFTDIESSTKRWEHQPELMQPAFDKQERIMRAAMAAHGGYVYKMIGDAFQVAFAAALDALAAALDAQRGLGSEAWGEIDPIRVRMALHTGVTEERGDDYVGPLLNRVARLMSAGYGGQVLLTQVTYELVRDKLPDDVTLRDLGEHRLKDLIRPEHVYQLSAPGLSADFPPLKTLDKDRHNLPVQTTSFIGRRTEMIEIEQAITEYHLVTLVGSGGSGKTRLSLQVAANLLDQFPDGTWFIELAPITNPELIPQTILAAMGAQSQPGKDALDSLKDFLREKNLLLILDNCEHLIEACAKLVDTLLTAAPYLKILASSREALGVKGEQAWHVPSLSIPDLKHLPAGAELSRYEAVHLFIDRARLVQPHFAVTNNNAPAVAQICYRLDGIPLAIELAAARLRILTPEQISARLDDRFRLLTGGSRTALPRQQTLRALIDWSYDLLSAKEKLLLSRLAVFSGGWTLELAEQICADEKLDAYEILDMLTHLVDKSLVAVEENQAAMRYRILETVRQYAREKLFESGKGLEMRNRHRDAFVKLVEQANPELKKDNAKKWFETLDAEQDNIRSAIWWSLENNCVESAIRICNALEYYWRMRGQIQEGYNFYLETFTLADKDETVKHTPEYVILWSYKVSYAFDVTFNLFSDHASLETALEITRRLEELHYPAGSYRIFYRLHGLYEVGGDLDSAEEVVTKALNGFRAAGHQEDMAWAFSGLASIYREKGEFEKSNEMDAQARDIFSKNGFTAFALTHANYLALKLYQRGEIQAARRELEANLCAFQNLDATVMSQDTLQHLMMIAILEGDYARAKKYVEDAAAYSEKFTEQQWEIIYNHLNYGYFAFITNDLETAYRFYKNAIEGMKINRGDIFAGEALARLGFTLLCMGRMDEARQCFEESFAAWGKVAQESDSAFFWYGRSELERMLGNTACARKNLQQAMYLRNKIHKYIYIPDMLDSFAKLDFSQNDFTGAARWFGCADALRKKFGSVMYPIYRPDYDKHLELLKSQISAAEFESAWAEGKKMGMNEAVALALQGYEPS
jgi:predicted ATPase/class 3 adenylate cyclase